MATLNIMIGIPGSGKTTYAYNYLFKKNTVYLSSDDTRKELFGYENQNDNNLVFNTIHKKCITYLDNDNDVIFDATNLSAKKRKNIIQQVINKGHQVDAYLCCTPINIILERNLTRTERKLPYDKLIQMIKQIEIPMYYEGFNHIYLIDGGMYNDIYDYNEMIKCCEDYQQDNPYHAETLDKHIFCVEQYISYMKNKIYQYDDNSIENKWSVLRQAARYHDFGKLYTKEYNVKKGYCTYYNHEKISAYLFLCHVRKQSMLLDDNKVLLSKTNYQSAAIILNHMKWYSCDENKIKEKLHDDELFEMLKIFHLADKWREYEQEDTMDNIKFE